MLYERVERPHTDAWQPDSFVGMQCKQRQRHYARAQLLSLLVGLPHELGALPDVFVRMPDVKVGTPSQHGGEHYEDLLLQRELALEPWEIVGQPSPLVGEQCAYVREQYS